MCGLVGLYNLQRQNFHVSESDLDAMQKRIAHRGPDSYGIWKSDTHGIGLAARRLSIIDLSDAGNQPMHDVERGIVVCLNGEIYNHTSVRAELEKLGYRYKSNSDTETIIYAYAEWGIKCLERFDGMFAIAIFDSARQQLYLVRDRMGVKPLYFSLQGNVLSFGSEIKALTVLPWIEKKISQLAWYHYLTFMVSPAPLTMYEGIYKLPAGFYAEVDPYKRISFTQWYTPLNDSQFSDKEMHDERFVTAYIKELLIRATQKRMIADVPVGAYLSGGLDSSLNVALMAQAGTRIKTFTVAWADDKEGNETAWARRVAQQFGTEHHELIISEKEAFDFYESMVYQLDEPLADCVCIPFYYISRHARDVGMKVVQVGEGADELFFGYSSYASYMRLYQRFWKPSRQFLPAFVRKGVQYLARPLVFSQPLRSEVLTNWASNSPLFWGGAIAFGEEQKRSVMQAFSKKMVEYDPIIDQMYPGMRQQFDSGSIVSYHLSRLFEADPQADIAKQMLYLELKQRLPELLLMRADKMAMAASIEAREPYLDYKLVEFMMNVPATLKYAHSTTKYLLKKVAEEFLPHDIIYRKKVGFGAPTSRWFTQGAYFPAYFQRMTQHAWNVPTGEGFPPIDLITNSNDEHRAVQNWVLQQLWAFSNMSEKR